MSILTATTDGEWTAGPNEGHAARTVDFIAGKLVTLDGVGELRVGFSCDFRSRGGLSGNNLMLALLDPPTVSGLHHGTIRESLALSSYVARHGSGETHCWDSQNRYVSDDGEGNFLIIHFDHAEGVFGLGFGHDSGSPSLERDFVRHVPLGLADIAKNVFDLPIFEADGAPVYNMAFWGSEGQLASLSEWHDEFSAGSDLLRHEIMSDRKWASEAKEYYELENSVLEVILDISDRFKTVGGKIRLSIEELEVVAPASRTYSRSARDTLRTKFSF